MKKKTALISFLGKSRINQDGLYREATYQLATGEQETSRLIGLTLANHLRPDKLVILGTPGSMWDLLLAEELALNANEAEICRVIDATRDDCVNNAELAPFEQLLSDHLGMEASLLIIPYGRNAAEQQTIVEIMAHAVEGCDRVHIDVTHGLRHLPMVAFAAAQLMQQLHGKTIEGLHYGALELTEGGVTPVLALDGLLLIDRWVKALHTFDKDGDYGVFVPLLEGLVEPVAVEQLRKAAFLERINNVRQARGQLRGLLKHLENKTFVQPIEKLFMPALKERIAWALAGRLGERQIQLAGHYLSNNDYIRAVLLAWEALITHETAAAGGDSEAYSDRDQTNVLLKEDPDLKKQYRVLRNLRNALAHGESSSLKEVQQLVYSEERLRDYLQEFLAELSTHICG